MRAFFVEQWKAPLERIGECVNMKAILTHIVVVLMTRAIRTVVLLSLLIFPLTACSSWWGDDTREISETIEINQPDLPSDTAVVDLSAAETALRTNAPKTMEDSAALMSNQGVQVYGLTGPAPVPSAPTQLRPRGFDVNPNVEVFPLDGPVNQPVMNQPSFAPPAYAQQKPLTAPSGQQVNHGDVIYFEHNSSKLGRNDLSVIRRVANSFRASGKSVLSVEGHASVRSSLQTAEQRHAANMKMSMERAYAVAAALIDAGVPARAIKTTAWGDSRMGEQPESAARRVEIIAQ